MTMGRLIDGDALYKAMQDAEELAMQRVLDTESTLPYPNNLNPAYIRYFAQLNERTKAKEMVADAPTVDAVPVVRCEDCRFWSKYPGSSAAPQYHECMARMTHIGNLYTTAGEYCSRGERKGR